MEGRLTLTTSVSEFEKLTGLTITAADLKEYFLNPKYNIAPSAFLPVTTNLSPTVLSLSKWGLIPGWTTSSKNAKGLTSISTLAFTDKPVLRQALSGKRCLIWCSGFHLWKDSPAGKIPFYVTLKSGKCFTIAGLWESWDEESTNTCCVITHNLSASVPFFKSEMPLVLAEGKRTEWLNEVSEPTNLLNALSGMAETEFDYFPVSRKIIKSPENDAKFIQKIPYLVAEQTNMFS